MRLKLIWLAVLNIVTIILLSTIWEFGLEERVSSLLGLDYDAGFETGERLRFILTASLFSMLAMIIPSLLIAGLIRKILLTENNALRLASTDELTGAGNRRAFNARIAQLKAADVPYVLMMIDINDFKSINDLNGHHQGDATLVSLARLLAESAGADTDFYRIGGDEFAVVIGGEQANEAVAMAENIRQRAADIKTGPATFLGLSVGVASSAYCGRYDIVRAADLAMYEAKRDKTLHLSQFSPGMEQRFRQKESFEHSVTAAIKSNDIVPFLQPIICLQTGNIIGFEILARWIAESGQAISPAVFLPVVESLGLMDILAITLLRTVIPFTADWPADMLLALNITPEQLLRQSLTEQLCNIMQEAGPLRLELEITEEKVMMISEEARRAISSLKQRGVGVVLDDFGTGYSNLSVLLGLGITKIKVDRSFVSSALENRQQKKVVETLLSLCHELEVEITAEGIEDSATLAWLKNRGCTYGQGYLFSWAVPPGQAVDMMKSGIAL